MRILVTGGAGFIGSALVRHLISTTDHEVMNVDSLTYAGILSSVDSVKDNSRYRFARVDIRDQAAIRALFEGYRPDVVAHLAAESHVDRSIDAPGDFIQTNIVGTFVMLQEALRFWRSLPTEQQSKFRFHHISTDEVFGSLGESGYFVETTPYDPRSPYSASKASADHLVRAWHETYGLPTLVTNCSNNYGPYHFPEKLIPLVIIRAIGDQSLPVYGDGTNIRDWLFVDDHAAALQMVFERGTAGETYNIGGNAERTNIDVVRAICSTLDTIAPKVTGSYADQITFVADRPGHDRRYAIDAGKIRRELGWQPRETFDSGIIRTVEWFLAHRGWWEDILACCSVTERLGLASQ